MLYFNCIQLICRNLHSLFTLFRFIFFIIALQGADAEDGTEGKEAVDESNFPEKWILWADKDIIYAHEN